MILLVGLICACLKDVVLCAFPSVDIQAGVPDSSYSSNFDEPTPNRIYGNATNGASAPQNPWWPLSKTCNALCCWSQNAITVDLGAARFGSSVLLWDYGVEAGRTIGAAGYLRMTTDNGLRIFLSGSATPANVAYDAASSIATCSGSGTLFSPALCGGVAVGLGTGTSVGRYLHFVFSGQLVNPQGLQDVYFCGAVLGGRGPVTIEPSAVPVAAVTASFTLSGAEMVDGDKWFLTSDPSCDLAVSFAAAGGGSTTTPLTTVTSALTSTAATGDSSGPFTVDLSSSSTVSSYSLCYQYAGVSSGLGTTSADPTKWFLLDTVTVTRSNSAPPLAPVAPVAPVPVPAPVAPVAPVPVRVGGVPGIPVAPLRPVASLPLAPFVPESGGGIFIPKGVPTGAVPSSYVDVFVPSLLASSGMHINSLTAYLSVALRSAFGRTSPNAFKVTFTDVGVYYISPSKLHLRIDKADMSPLNVEDMRVAIMNPSTEIGRIVAGLETPTPIPTFESSPPVKPDTSMPSGIIALLIGACSLVLLLIVFAILFILGYLRRVNVAIFTSKPAAEVTHVPCVDTHMFPDDEAPAPPPKQTVQAYDFLNLKSLEHECEEDFSLARAEPLQLGPRVSHTARIVAPVGLPPMVAHRGSGAVAPWLNRDARNAAVTSASELSRGKPLLSELGKQVK